VERRRQIFTPHAPLVLTRGGRAIGNLFCMKGLARMNMFTDGFPSADGLNRLGGFVGPHQWLERE
jgi:hypothetical protein